MDRYADLVLKTLTYNQKRWKGVIDQRFPHKTMYCSSLPPVVCEEFMSYLRYLSLFTNSGVQHMLCCWFCFVSLRLVCSMSQVSLDYPYLIAPSVFSNVYLSCVPNVASFSGLSIFYCPFGILQRLLQMIRHALYN
jgi:hypothetical protein